MALVPNDFTAPQGDLKPKMFPDYDSLTDAVQGWIDKGTDVMADEFGGPASVPDNAVKHYVYWRAYRDIYIRLSNDPQRVGVSETVNYGYTQNQAERFREMADEHKDSLDSIRYPDTSGIDHDDPPTSGSVGTSVSYG